MVHSRKQSYLHKKRTSRGQGMVEFALALPVFLLLVLGVIEFGRLLAVVSSVTTAAREGARYGSAAGLNDGIPSVPFYNDCQGMRDAAKRVGLFAGIQDADIQIGYFDTDSRSDVPPPTGYAADKLCTGTTSTYEYDPALGPRVVMRVSVPFKFLFLGLSEFPISSQSARTIVTQIEMDVTPGTVTPAPLKSQTPSPTIDETVMTLTPTPSVTMTHTATPTIDLTLVTLTPTPTETVTPTPLPPCGFIHVGGGIISGKDRYSFSIYNGSGVSGNPYPAQDVWVSGISISWGSDDPKKTITLSKINFTGVGVYTSDGGENSPKYVGFGDGSGPHITASSNGPLDFIFTTTGAQVVITDAWLVMQYHDSSGYHNCPDVFRPQPLVQ